MVLGALAIAENYPEEAGAFVKNAVKFVPNCVKHFAPDGDCENNFADICKSKIKALFLYRN